MPGTTKYPAQLDDATTLPQTAAPGSGNPAADSNNQAAALLALQAKVGADGSAVPGSLDHRLAQVEDALATGGGGTAPGGYQTLVRDLGPGKSTGSVAVTQARTHLRASGGTVHVVKGGSSVDVPGDGTVVAFALAPGDAVTVSAPAGNANYAELLGA